MNILNWIRGKRTWHLYKPNGWKVKDSIFVTTFYGTEAEAKKTGLLYSALPITDEGPDAFERQGL